MCLYSFRGGYSTSAFPDPLNSVLHLCGEEENSLDEYRIPGLLSHLFLSAQVVSLAGNECEIGKFENCGDIMALPNALLYAGARPWYSASGRCRIWPLFSCSKNYITDWPRDCGRQWPYRKPKTSYGSWTVSDICQRLKQQQKLLPEAQSQWLRDLLMLLEGQGDLLPGGRRQKAVAMLIACREPVMAGMEDLNDLGLKDFIFPGPQKNLALTTLLAAIGFDKPDSCPYHHPFYWGAFFL